MPFEEFIPNQRENIRIGFENATNFDELYDMIRAKGEIEGTQKIYSADEVIKVIERVRHGHRDITFVTRSYGLHDTVKRLSSSDKIYRKYVIEE